MDKSAFGVYSKPNFFELFLREHIDDSLYKAFKFIIKTLSTRYPENTILNFIKRHKTSIYYSLLCIIDTYTLTQHSSTLSEHFLNMKRVSSTNPNKLTPTDISLSLFCTLCIPFITRHFHKTAKRYNLGKYFTEDDEHGESLSARYARLITILYPYIRASTGLASLGYTIAYIGDITRYASPQLHFSKINLASVSPCEKVKVQGILGTLSKGVGDSLRLVLPLLAFGYRSLEWWYSIPESVAGSSGAVGQELLPPAPEPPKVCGGVTVPPFERCPVCGRKRTNPAVLAPSGFAFCYPCIVKYVREYSKCPVTGLPANETQIRRLFVK